MISAADIQSHAYFYTLITFSFWLLAGFSILGFPGLLVAWFLRRKSIWLRVGVGALSVVVMSVVVPAILLLLLPYEPSDAVLISPTIQDSP